MKLFFFSALLLLCLAEVKHIGVYDNKHLFSFHKCTLGSSSSAALPSLGAQIIRGPLTEISRQCRPSLLSNRERSRIHPALAPVHGRALHRRPVLLRGNDHWQVRNEKKFY